MSEIRTDTINNASGDNDSGIDLSTNDVVAVKIAGSEKARVDSSGNLLVSKTAGGSGTAGIQLESGGRGGFTKDNAYVTFQNRLSSDGEISRFMKDGSTVGSIGSVASGANLYISANSGVGLGIGDDNLYPVNASGTSTDNSLDIGDISARFDDIYASNGTIQTSDQNEKNTITDSDLGIDFIKRLTPKSYIFNGKTRTHYGLIAQDVETVLTDINKPTSGFAGFIKSDISEEQDGSEYSYGLRYTEFVAPLIQAVKDQQAIIEDLQARIEALENS